MSGLPYKVLVISSCTGQKVHATDNMPSLDDFRNPAVMAKKEKELLNYKMPAAQMYTGKQHKHVVDGLNILRGKYGKDCISLKILSAGYGLLDENDIIIPYNASFSDMRAQEIVEWSKELSIKKDSEIAIKNYDLIIFLLGANYLRALSLPIKSIDKQKLIFITGWSSSELIPDLDNYWLIGSSQEDATTFGSALVSLKGLFFKMLCQEVFKNADELINIFKNPEHIYRILYRYRKDVQDKQLNLFDETKLPSCEDYINEVKNISQSHRRKFAGYIVKDLDIAANYRVGKTVKYFIPEWDDRVDPDYDFKNDIHNRGDVSPYKHDKYAHEIYSKPNYDGILVSLSVLDEGKKQLIGNKGIHDFLRFPKSYPVMADCGAFNYIASENPPFQTAEVIEYYDRFGFDYGVSIDHLIVGDFEKDHAIKNKRYRLTQRNAEEFIKLHKAGNYSFKPIGVAQGWDPDSYRESVELLIEAGYEYIAIGSLIPKKTHEIYHIMRAVAPILPEYLDVHLFGITRLEGLQSFYKLGATSFDSAGPLRQAWLSARSNYYTMERVNDNLEVNSGYKKYAAIRIPYVNSKDLDVSLINQLKKLEQEALYSIRAYDKKQIALNDVIEIVMAYEYKNNEAKFIRAKEKVSKATSGFDQEREYKKLINKKDESKRQIQNHKELYREVLEKRPWEQCDCEVCKEIGIEVIIFRGNNRNRRRGFHNTYVFYKQNQKLISGNKDS